MDDFDRVVVDDSDLTYVVEGIGDDSKEMVSLVNRGGGGFEEIFTELAPEAVEHEFGSGFTSGIFLDETGIEVDAFFFLVSGDILGFVLRRDGPSRVASVDSSVIFPRGVWASPLPRTPGRVGT